MKCEKRRCETDALAVRRDPLMTLPVARMRGMSDPSIIPNSSISPGERHLISRDLPGLPAARRAISALWAREDMPDSSTTRRASPPS